MTILKSTVLALATAASLGVAALSSATPASAHYWRYSYRPYYTYSYHVYRPYCVIKWSYGVPYKVCF